MPVIDPAEMADADRRLERAFRDPVRARALGPRDRGSGARRRDRHGSDQPRFRARSTSPRRSSCWLTNGRGAQPCAADRRRTPRRARRTASWTGSSRQLDEALVSQGLFSPAVANPGDAQHHPHHLHQDPMVVTRGQGRSWNHPGVGRTDASALIGVNTKLWHGPALREESRSCAFCFLRRWPRCRTPLRLRKRTIRSFARGIQSGPRSERTCGRRKSACASPTAIIVEREQTREDPADQSTTAMTGCAPSTPRGAHSKLRTRCILTSKRPSPRCAARN